MGKQYEKPDMEINEFNESDFVVTLKTSGEGQEGSKFDQWIQ